MLNSAQSEMQEHFSALFKEKTLPHFENIVKDSENVANQYMILSEIVDTGDIVSAFEKVQSIGFTNVVY